MHPTAGSPWHSDEPVTPIICAETEKACALLLEFMSTMKNWENKFVELHKHNSTDSSVLCSQAGVELQAIYAKYLTKRDRKLGRIVDGTASFGWPPEFDPEAETIVATQSVNKRKAIIETLWTHPTIVPSYSVKHLFTLICKHDEWRLDTKRAYHQAKGKWVTQVL